MKNKLLISTSILIALLSVGFGYGLISKSKTISETTAIETIKNTLADLKEYPSDQLPPKSIKTERADNGWYVAFIQEGSGRPIISAKCFFVDNHKGVTKTGEFNPNSNDVTRNISPKTCSAAAPAL